MGGVARAPRQQSAAGAAHRRRGFLADQFRAKAKATSIARRLSSVRRFYALQLQQGTLRATRRCA
jgi:site-specific recombinase XerC